MIADNKAKKILNISGGTHHGRKSQAFGFCFLNDCVLAILKALEKGFKNIVYIDLDAHHCDGVQDVFLENENVSIISIHEKNRNFTLHLKNGFFTDYCLVHEHVV